MANTYALRGILSLLLLSPTVGLAGELSTLIGRHDYAAANKAARQIPARQVIAQVYPLSLSNDAPAQWILADAYWRNKNSEQATRWAYTALISTQLDITPCNARENIVAWMMQSYEPIFTAARRDPALLSGALKSALAHHANIKTLPKDVYWACRVGSFLLGTPEKDNRANGYTNQEILQERAATLDRLARKSGLALETLRQDIEVFPTRR